MTASNVVPFVEGAAKRVRQADRDQLVGIYDHYKAISHELLRRLIVEQNRIDVLAEHVLGYIVTPMHLAMMQWQFLHRDSLILAYRGSGKSTICTVTKAIHLLLKDRNLRIVLASKSKGNSESFLKEIKEHFENNRLLVELFGEFYDPRRVAKWGSSEIEIVGRTKVYKEASLTCVGCESAVVSKHYDVAISDDVVDEDNSRTKFMRDKTRTWNYQTLEPTIEPPDPNVPHRGEHHRQGTHYHFDDFYSHLRNNELKDHTLVIPALSEAGHSAWPEKFPVRWFLEKKARSGTIIFQAQYQVDTEAMKGEIFQYDDCQQIDPDEYPSGLKNFIGVDLAITEDTKNDQFACVVIGCLGKPFCGRDPEAIFVQDYYAGHIRFSAQTQKILKLYDEWDPLITGVESNAYQLAQYQELKDQRKDGRFMPIHTDKDKISNAWKLSALFEAKKVFFKKGLHGPLVDQLVLFPSYRFKDLFDALWLAVRSFKKKRRRERGTRREPGVI